jgi:hypothetical protein
LAVSTAARNAALHGRRAPGRMRCVGVRTCVGNGAKHSYVAIALVSPEAAAEARAAVRDRAVSALSRTGSSVGPMAVAA